MGGCKFNKKVLTLRRNLSAVSTKLKHIYPLTVSALLCMSGCGTTRHIPEGAMLLDDVKITVNDSTHDFDTQQLAVYLRQQPNHKMLWSMKFRMGVYNMSGADSTKWYNKWLRKLGEAPVIYDSTLTQSGSEQLRKALVNQGYLDAEVRVKEEVNSEGNKVKLDYELTPGQPHVIRNIEYVFKDRGARDIAMADSANFLINPGDLLDRSLLEKQRDLLTVLLRNHGYYGFAKEYITFNADTTAGSRLVDLTMTLNVPRSVNTDTLPAHRLYTIGRIFVVTDYNPATDVSLRNIPAADTVAYKDLTILYGPHRYLRPAVLYENCQMRSGRYYRQEDVEKTYSAFSRLSILKFMTIRFEPAPGFAGGNVLDTYILLTPGKSQSMSVELEGTNSEGDLGVAAAATYTHRNIGKGSETLTTKLRGAYESLSGNLDGLLNDRYMEYSLDLGLNFPKFKAPLLSERFKRRVNASSELNVAMTYQERPEYTRIISNAGWSYKWTHNRNHNRFIFTPLDINYVYLPKSTYNFIDQIAPDNPLLRYSYEDHFIMRLGFGFYHTNKHADNRWRYFFQRNIYTVRANAEVAGNLLFLASNIIGHRDDYRRYPYRIFGIHYSQYFKINADFALLHTFDNRNSMAFHLGFGVGYPYGNSTILPFEKRFYGGGANGVRGWDVRTLGPGRYPGTNNVSDFINQCGDIRLDLSAEYRAKLFWILELGAFIDAGNIWTIHNYATQPGGMFHFNSFYEELAAAYGLGLRMDFSFFLLRFDLGMKAHNPASGAVKWPLFHPDWHRDSSFHFSIGYPF